jgi:hypothetical protein
MPAIPEPTRDTILLRLLDHAGKNWPQLKNVQARYRGSFACITGVLPDGEQIPLFRLRYGAPPALSDSPSTPPPAIATKTPYCAPATRPAPRKKASIPHAPSTWPGSDTNQLPDPDELTELPT